MSVIELEGVTVERRRFTLEVKTMKVGHPDLVLIIGRNGSGKTTLCYILAGIIEAGDGLRGDVRLPTPTPVLMWQDLELFPLSVEGNLRVVNPNRDAVDKLLGDFGLRSERNKRVDELSGGFRERLAIARALAVPQSKCVILDEPTKAADKERVKDVARYIAEANGNGLAVVVVTHDERLVAEIGEAVSSVYVIDDSESEGRRIGNVSGPYTGDEFFSKPATVFAAKFAGYENIFRMVVPKHGKTLDNLCPLDESRGSDTVLVVPWSGLKVAAEASAGSVPVEVGQTQFRANGTRVIRCVWKTDWDAPLEFVVPFEPDLKGKRLAHLSLLPEECFVVRR